MASEGLENDEWDEEIFKLIVQAEEQRRVHHQPCPTPSAPAPIDVSYSLPRELSQRPREASKISAVVERFAPVANSCGKEVEIDRLKNELGRGSKQLNLLEKECSELRKERGKKEEQLKVLIHPKDAELARANSSDYS